MLKHHLNKAEFYITNVCNLDCNHCNRFNNYNFKGWQNWDDYAEVYQSWGNYLDIDNVVILGGEPLLNPGIIKWIYGLNEIWPNVQIQTNGTRLNYVPGLYQALLDRKCWIGVSLHNVNELSWMEQQITNFMAGSIQKQKLNPADGQGDICYKDSNGIEIKIWFQNQFQTSAIIPKGNGRLTLHNSDPIRAHEQCPFARWKCYHFIRGALYKCGPVALFPEFHTQHNLDISPVDQNLINSYTPLTVDQWDQRGAEFLALIDEPIAQCKFCPDYVSTEIIAPTIRIKNA
jgi:hypothetical protein